MRLRSLSTPLTSIHRSQIAQCEHRGGRYSLHVRQYFIAPVPRWDDRRTVSSRRSKMDTYLPESWWNVLEAHTYRCHHHQSRMFLSSSMDEHSNWDPSFLSSMIADICPVDQADINEDRFFKQMRLLDPSTWPEGSFHRGQRTGSSGRWEKVESSEEGGWFRGRDISNRWRKWSGVVTRRTRLEDVQLYITAEDDDDAVTGFCFFRRHPTGVTRLSPLAVEMLVVTWTRIRNQQCEWI